MKIIADKSDFLSFKIIAITAIIFISCTASGVQRPSGYTIINIKEFGAKGDGKTNDHQAFVKAANFFNTRKGQGKLTIPAGTYIVGSQSAAGVANGYLGQDVLRFINCEDLTVTGIGKVTLKMKDGLKIGSFDRSTGKPFHSSEGIFTDPNYMSNPGNVISLKNCRKVSISNLTINGNNLGMVTGGKFGDVGFQVPACGLYIINSFPISVSDVKVSYCGQDGMLLKNPAPQKEKTPDQQVRILNSSFQYNARQGLSWVGGSGLRAENCDFSHTGRGKFSSSPGAGVDIEAEEATVSGGRFINCSFIDNAGAGMVADNGPSSDCVFSKCTFWGTTTWSMWTVKPKFRFDNCNFYGSIVHGCDAEKAEDATIFTSCLFEDKPYKGVAPFGNFLAESNGRRRLQFNGCTFSSRTKRLIWNSGNDGWTLAEMPLYKNCTFNIYNIPFPKPDYYIKLHRVKLEANTENFYSSKKTKNNYAPAYGINTVIAEGKTNYLSVD